MKMLKTKLSILLILAATVCGCTDFLDVSDELEGELTTAEIFNTPEEMRSFHRTIFSGVTVSSKLLFVDHNPHLTENPWPGVTDELKMSHGYALTRTVTGYNAGNAPFHRWFDLYETIRQANIFLENAKVIPESGSADYIAAAELAQMKAQARFLRAYYHYLLFELYGPVPIMDEAVDPDDPDLDFSRNSVDEVVDFVTAEMDTVAGRLNEIETEEAQLALPTKGVALAVKSKMLVYAASPLFNGGYEEALDVTNPESGKRLFPDHDPDKWQRALDALQEFIDFAETGHYELYKEYDSEGNYDPHASLYNLFMDYNSEVIWANPYGAYGGIHTWQGIDNLVAPRTEQGEPTFAVTQELVDDFFMIDGRTIDESPMYSEQGFSTAGEDKSGQTEPGTYRMWINREPRFYQTVFYQGRRWHMSNNVIKFHQGTGNDNSHSRHPHTGYLMYKRASRSVSHIGTHAKSEYRPSFIFRLAEFYLLYAEALNEVDPNDPRILEYIDKVRERAGIPKLADIKPEIQGDQVAQREAIRREMRVELCTEGQRYFNVRRWMIAENSVGGGGQGGNFYGMNMDAEVEENFYQRTLQEVRAWDRAMYLYPIPQDEINKSTKLVQNPGW